MDIDTNALAEMITAAEGAQEEAWANARAADRVVEELHKRRDLAALAARFGTVAGLIGADPDRLATLVQGIASQQYSTTERVLGMIERAAGVQDSVTVS